jgi:hypothetical protein
MNNPIPLQVPDLYLYFVQHSSLKMASVNSNLSNDSPPFHAVIPDAVWVLRYGALVTVDLPPPTDDDVETIVLDVCRRTTAHIDRRSEDGTLAAPTTDDDCDDARNLAQLALTDTVARKPIILDDFPAAPPSPRKLTAHAMASHSSANPPSPRPTVPGSSACCVTAHARVRA